MFNVYLPYVCVFQVLVDCFEEETSKIKSQTFLTNHKSRFNNVTF